VYILVTCVEIACDIIWNMDVRKEM